VSRISELGVIAGPLAITMALAATGVAGVRSSRRAREIDRALHELRRPLQVLALSGDRSADPATATATDLALVALDDLSAAISGSPPARRPRPVAARALVAGAVERWRAPAARAGKALALHWNAGRANVFVDPSSAGRALDNLLANAVEHGGLCVGVSARIRGSAVRVEVRDRRPPAHHRPGAPRDGHGHGLPIVAGIAREHGGSFSVSRSAGGTVAILELPLASRPAPVHTAA
jgi:signal transduction histidine kinase